MLRTTPSLAASDGPQAEQHLRRERARACLQGIQDHLHRIIEGDMALHCKFDEYGARDGMPALLVNFVDTPRWGVRYIGGVVAVKWGRTKYPEVRFAVTAGRQPDDIRLPSSARRGDEINAAYGIWRYLVPRTDMGIPAFGFESVFEAEGVTADHR